MISQKENDTLDGVACVIQDERVFAEGTRNNDHPNTKAGFYHIPSHRAYKGLENPLVLTMTATVVSYCYFDLRMYPFDQQQCHVLVQLSQASRSQVEVSESSHVVWCSKGREEYQVTKCFLCISPGGFNLTLGLERRSEYHVWATYLPTALLLGIGYGTLFLPVESFPERGGMSLTTLLVLISLYTETASTLPKTPYLKLIDIWFVFNIVYLSLIITTHLVACRKPSHPTHQHRKVPLLMHYFHEQEKEEEEEKKRSSGPTLILKVAQYTFGMVTVTFLVAYFMAALK